MTSTHITYHLNLARISEMHTEAAVARLANEVARAHRPKARRSVAQWLQIPRGPSREQAATDPR
jgi:hypothetical protein